MSALHRFIDWNWYGAHPAYWVALAFTLCAAVAL